MRQTTAAVIGAAGFLGSSLVRRFEAEGVQVARYTRSDPFVRPDGKLLENLASVGSVFWLASSIRPATAGDDPLGVEADRTALIQLLNALTQRPDPPRMIVVSSGGTIYDTDYSPPYSEDAPVRPTNAYGEAMLEIERTVRDWGQSVVMRVGNAYGPGQQARRGQGVIAYWLSAVAAQQPIHVVGTEDVARDYVFIDDVAEALHAAHEHADPPDLVNIGSGKPTSLSELLDVLRSVVAPTPLIVRHDPARSFDAPSTWLDTSLAAKGLGWKAETALEDGLSQTWRWLRSDDGRSGN